ncbi:2Fe-2S iron-sulfur cluster binding domain-containing protein [Nocardia vulneris]|uniref:2Fe-2S iron-sulfur cluster-binding protein n=1 Tax=Nocardia vulneris TaxID=1141657 RepID=UPI0030CA9F3C
MIRPSALVVRLRRSGRTLTVPAELTVLEALERAGIEIPSLCRASAAPARPWLSPHRRASSGPVSPRRDRTAC